MGFATATDGVGLWYDLLVDPGELAGTSTVLLIAGQALDHAGWRTSIAHFTAAHRVLVFDHRGVGLSGTGPRDGAFPADWSTRDFAGDVVSILDAAGVERAHVYGHSMGGRIAQWLAADHPARVSSLALGATTVGDSHGVARSPEATRILTSGGVRPLLELFYTSDWIARHERAASSVLPVAATPDSRRGHFLASSTHDAWDALALITAPTLVIHGTDDVLCPPENARILAERIPNAELYLIDGARHAYYVERPETDDVVLAHFARHDGS